MSSKKKKLLISCIVAILLCGLSSIAFLASRAVSDNVITFGNLKLQLINNTIDESGREVPVEQLEEKLTGDTVSRIIKVKNVCENPMFVRVKIDIKGEDNQGEFSLDDYVSYDKFSGDWTAKDGWFYYKNELQKENITSDLIRELNFDLNRLMTNHAGCKLTFKVSAQAVQSENNGMSAEEAKGWPQEARR